MTGNKFRKIEGLPRWTVRADLNDNLLESVSLAGNDQLRTLALNGNRLTSLVLPETCNIEILNLVNMDLEEMPNFRHCWGLQSVDVSNNRLQSLAELDWFLSLRTVVASNNHLEELEVPRSASTLDVTGNLITDVYSSPLGLTALILDDNPLQTVVLENSSTLTDLVFTAPSLTSVTLRSLSALESLQVSPGQLSSLDLADLPRLREVDAQNNLLRTLDLAGAPALSRALLAGNLLEALPTSLPAELPTADLSNNSIVQWVWNGSTQFGELILSNNRMQAVTLDAELQVTSLDVSDNLLTSVEWLQGLHAGTFVVDVSGNLVAEAVDAPQLLALARVVLNGNCLDQAGEMSYTAVIAPGSSRAGSVECGPH
mmetsp:Transcript_60772/g.163058  ORF Transcript_60772/g.163058 Transcript_60772/m.163058 type:complete len:371 (-) Transcript_60772:101-1213(-)